MRIVHIAAEFAPIAKAGGLGDAVYGLAKEQAKHQNDVFVILPYYDSVSPENLTVYKDNLLSTEKRCRWKNTIWQTSVDNITVYLIQTHNPRRCFHGRRVYKGKQDIRRFLYFSQTAFQFLQEEKQVPDILNMHDWHTGFISFFVHTQAHSNWRPGLVLTIHSLHYQGRCYLKDLSRIGFTQKEVQQNALLHDVRNKKQLNILRASLEYSDQIICVSPQYAKEVTTSQYGGRLQSVMLRLQDKTTGILNGIDYTYWNPEIDPALQANYPSDSAQIDLVRKKKEENKQYLFQQLQLAPTNDPLVVVISRIVTQKGPKLMMSGLLHTIDRGGTFVILGSIREGALEKPFFRFAQKVRPNPHASVLLQFDEKLSRLLFAAADILFVPSLFEPCGLTQLIAMRYGTVPIVRQTGGLCDTVHDPITNPPHPCGLTFDKPKKEDVQNVLDRAFSYYRTEPELWNTLIKNGLDSNFTWESAQEQYKAIYEKALSQELSFAKS